MIKAPLLTWRARTKPNVHATAYDVCTYNTVCLNKRKIMISPALLSDAAVGSTCPYYDHPRYTTATYCYRCTIIIYRGSARCMGRIGVQRLLCSNRGWLCVNNQTERTDITRDFSSTNDGGNDIASLIHGRGAGVSQYPLAHTCSGAHRKGSGMRRVTQA